MYQVFIVANNSNANISLSFMEKEAAQTALLDIDTFVQREKTITLKDDFGYVLKIPFSNLCYAVMIDVEKSQSMAFERELVVNKAQTEIMSDSRASKLAVNGNRPTLVHQ